VDILSQQLEAAELEMIEKAEEERAKGFADAKLAVTTITNQYNVNPRQVNPGSMHGPTAIAMTVVEDR